MCPLGDSWISRDCPGGLRLETYKHVNMSSVLCCVCFKIMGYMILKAYVTRL